VRAHGDGHAARGGSTAGGAWVLVTSAEGVPRCPGAQVRSACGLPCVSQSPRLRRRSSAMRLAVGACAVRYGVLLMLSTAQRLPPAP
jgi:hypothetical protein